MNKYADDIILIIPASLSSTCAMELQHIQDWSAGKNLQLNRSKSAELVFRARGVRTDEIPPPLPGIPRVTEIKILEVVVKDDLKMTSHIASTIAACNQSLYALQVLKTHGMQPAALQTVFRSTCLAKLLY